jgi:hypothetical protein
MAKRPPRLVRNIQNAKTKILENEPTELRKLEQIVHVETARYMQLKQYEMIKESQESQVAIMNKLEEAMKRVQVLEQQISGLSTDSRTSGDGSMAELQDKKVVELGFSERQWWR